MFEIINFSDEYRLSGDSQTANMYRGADKSLARPGREQATATKR